MNEPYEPSYYEIALTGRQVLAAFVILLVCLVAAFFSGVWVAREGGEPDAARPQAAEAEVPEHRPDELSFFEEEPMERPRPLGEVAQEARPGTTLREDVGDRGAAEPEPGAPPEDPAATAATEPPPARDRGTAAGPGRSLASGDLVIQVLVSSEEAKAREILDRLTKNGFRAFLSPVTDRGRTLYRVRVGPFERKSDAEAVAERLRSSLQLDTWITQ
ncbi:MAG TPA: SPOR domain-containing protein [Thermoanaerobaculia bacterium]|nr:SPOR domain-containing protein [Thermoanaerobaculia bacterium]